ncbi:MAG: hypothetical protein E7564_01580 [Ruminococcaceae bacterium]|nr:hypothetical protein [Oscillospiraceae bacterium]
MKQNKFKIYGKFFSINLKTQLQYKGSFVMMFFGQFLTAFSGFMMIYFLFDRFNAVKDFSINEVLLCYSVSHISFSLSEVFVRGFDAFGSTVRTGDFDRILLRPGSTIFLILCSKMDFTRLAKALNGVIIMIFAVINAGIIWDGMKIFTLVLMVLCGMALYSALFLIYAALCFYTTQGLEVMNIFTDGGREFGQYPLSVYGENVLKFLTFVVPMALFQYYPFLYLTGRVNSMVYCFLPLGTLPFMIPAYIIWRVGLKHYKSTGS